ncbi:MAG: nitrous oxide-stimulated promoter family protein [Planctomycetota bacterium]|nr:MAG: nitrous oxide-stimulated promoter family protein [Planctomycetota bacterium]
MKESLPRRLRREQKTLEAMVRIACRHQHGETATARKSSGQPCASCQDLQAYAFERIERCPFGAAKPSCAKCSIHCYPRGRREPMQALMRVAGPKMVWRHPFLAMAHLMDGRRDPHLPRKARHRRPRPAATELCS